MSKPALIREADLARVLRVAKKVGVDVRVEMEAGRVIVTTGKAAAMPATNSLDEMFGA